MAPDDLASRAAALEERARAARPTTWRPDDDAHEHPHVIVGQLVEWDRRASGYNPDRDVDIATLQLPEGNSWAVWGHGAVLEQEFAKLRARPDESIGALVAIRYEGLVEKAGGRPYKSYRVVVDRAAADGDVEPAATSPKQLEASTTPVSSGALCERCGYGDPEHAAGCPNDDSVPF